jgi:LAO/AO transport system ATPase
MATIGDLVRAAAANGPGAVRPAARLMTLVADDPARLPEIYHATAALADPARLLHPRLLVGITGAPGSGKSTLTDALIREYRRRFPERRVGVVAVDPSSPYSGGAVLGDRVRMMRHGTDPLVFVRSMASRGHLGGLALGVKGVIRVMGLIGCDVVFVETVGVGQSEIEVAAVADVVMIVLAPGQGDSVQLLKAGLMEIGDVFVVNKADRPDANRLHADLVAMLEMARGDARDAGRAAMDAEVGADWWPLLTRRRFPALEPRTFLVSAEEGTGIDALAGGLEDLAAAHAPEWQQQRLRAIEDEVREAIVEQAARHVRDTMRTAGEAARTVSAVLQDGLPVGAAAVRLLQETARRLKDDDRSRR